jgi:anthranilate synthase component 2
VILLLDNRDSFTFNLYQQVARQGPEVRVVRCDAMGVEELLALRPEALVISPGPGRPEEAGVLMDLLDAIPEDLPVLGVCLGHQALVMHHGGEIEQDPVPVHGRCSLVHHSGRGLLADLPSPFEAARYHSLRAERDRLPPELEVTAWTEDGIVMALEHTSLPRHGVQFHPESILTPLGDRLVGRFLELL